MTIRDLMSTCTAECTEDISLGQVFEEMQKCENGFAVVIDSRAHRIPIGLVTEHSICEQVVGRGRDPRNLTAANVMDTRMIRIDANADIRSCVDLIAAAIFAHAVVVGENRQLCGVVSDEVLKSIRNRLVVNRSPEQRTAPFPEIQQLDWVN